MTATLANPAPVLAACANPTGAEGEMIYNDDFNVAQFCNGTSWVSMSGGASAGAESDPQVGATTNNKWCRGDGSSVVCDQDTPSVTETDPEVGTLTSGKWCMTNGTEVQCASDLPIGTLTNGKFCTTNGTTISCTTDAPTTTAGADTQVIFNSGGALTGDASFVWDNTNKRLGIGNTPSTELEVTGTVKSSGPFWSAFGAAGTHRGLLLENFDNTAVAHGVDMAAKLGGTEFQGLSWVKETAWLSGAVAADKDAMLQFGVLLDNAPSVPMVIRANGSVGIGTTTPTFRLDVNGTLRAYSGSESIDLGGDGLRFTGPSPHSIYSSGYAGQIKINGASIALNDASAGNVGIGTASPSDRLHVSSGSTTVGLTLQSTNTYTRLKSFDGGAGGEAILDIIPMPQTNTDNSWVRLFRDVNTSGLVRLAIGRGDGTASSNSVLGGNTDTSLNALVGSVAIGTATPNASALLDVSSTTKGFLPPRVTTAERNAIATPAEGLTVYNTTTDGLETYGNGFWQTGAALRNVGRGTSGNYNTIIQNTPGGIWWMDGPGSTNGPTGTNTGTLVHLDPLWNQGASANQYAIQLATNGNTGDKLYFRHQYGGTWGNWVDLTGGGGGSASSFGSWASAYTPATNYQAATDGFVVAVLSQSNGGDRCFIEGFTDASATPTTVRGREMAQETGTSDRINFGSFTMPVRKNDYWRVTVGQEAGTCNSSDVAIYWISGSGSAAVAGGSNSQVQFNDSGAFGADSSFVWDNTNKRLGIGTTSPQRQLELAGATGGTSAVLRLNKSDSNAAAVIAYTEFGGSGTGWGRTGWVGDGNGVEQAISLFGDTGSDLRLGANGAEVVRILASNGNVGIGTTAPTSMLELVSTSAAALPLTITKSAGGLLSNGITGRASRGTPAAPTATQNNDRTITIAGASYGGTTWVTNAAINLATAQAQSETARGSYITFETTPIDSVSRAERMRIDATGRVGIGRVPTTSPLEIQSDTNSRLRILAGATAVSAPAVLELVGSNTTPTVSQEAQLVAYQPSGGGLADAALDIRIRKNGDAFGSPSTIMTMLGTGNVGIGTTTPGSTLDVKGTLRLSGATSGYVGFAPAAAAGSTTYTLPTADGSNGQVLSTNGAGALSWATPSASGIPTGAIMAFDLTTCPTGWTEYTAARGRFLRGIDNGAGNDPDGTRTPGSTQVDTFASHSHQVNAYNGGTPRPVTISISGSPGGHATTLASDPTGGDETRPKNVAVLFCRKN